MITASVMKELKGPYLFCIIICILGNFALTTVYLVAYCPVRKIFRKVIGKKLLVNDDKCHNSFL